MIPKIGKKLKTDSLNCIVTGSKKEQCTSTCSLLKIFETNCCCEHERIPTNNLKSASRHLKTCGMVKVVLFFTLIQKYN